MMRRVLLIAAVAFSFGTRAWAQADPVTYRVTFPEPEHHWLQVEATFPDLDSDSLRIRMSRSSPGRYAVHGFAKNVFQVEAFDGSGSPLALTRPRADEWAVGDHDGAVRIVYRIFGDHADGTYMGVDTTHAHLNMPATFMWADGLDQRPVRVSFVPPSGSRWKAATQLFPTADPFAFTAPNLQYFMDSPVELSDFLETTFELENTDGTTASVRLVVHADASQGDVTELAASVERLMHEQIAVFGELPAFEPGAYTVLLDLVPWVFWDAMEHRNSTSISIPGASLRTAAGRRRVLAAVSHEFFHVWNVERIRPRDLEPFDFTRENVSCCLWLAEGFTQYYGSLLLTRAGLTTGPPVGVVSPVVSGSGRLVRSPVEMSALAAFTDAAVANDATDHARSFISYYTYGAALALALDLSLRERSAGVLSLDEFMRRLWTAHGRPADPRPGYVANPYSLAEVRDTLADLTDTDFAQQFFASYVEGRDVPDFARLLAQAGYLVRPASPDRAWIGGVPMRTEGSGLVVGVGPSGVSVPVPFDSPLYAAGVDTGDVVTRIDGRQATEGRWEQLSERRPGTAVTLVVRRRDGEVLETVVRLQADPRLEVVPVETTGQAVTVAEQEFREGWFGTRVSSFPATEFAR